MSSRRPLYALFYIDPFDVWDSPNRDKHNIQESKLLVLGTEILAIDRPAPTKPLSQSVWSYMVGQLALSSKQHWTHKLKIYKLFSAHANAKIYMKQI